MPPFRHYDAFYFFIICHARRFHFRRFSFTRHATIFAYVISSSSCAFAPTPLMPPMSRRRAAPRRCQERDCCRHFSHYADVCHKARAAAMIYRHAMPLIFAACCLRFSLMLPLPFDADAAASRRHADAYAADAGCAPWFFAFRRRAALLFDASLMMPLPPLLAIMMIFVAGTLEKKKVSCLITLISRCYFRYGRFTPPVTIFRRFSIFLMAAFRRAHASALPIRAAYA